MSARERAVARFRDLSIRSRLLIILVFATFVPLAIGVWQALRIFESWAASELQVELQEQDRLFELVLDHARSDVLNHVEHFSSSLTTSSALREHDPAALLTPAINLAEETRRTTCTS